MTAKARFVFSDAIVHDRNHYPARDRDALTWKLMDDHLFWVDMFYVPAVMRAKIEEEAREMKLTARWG